MSEPVASHDPTQLRELAAALRCEALDLLDRSGLLVEVRGSLGRVDIVGSVALDLMVWRDIDLHVRLSPDQGADLLAFASDAHGLLDRRGYAVVRVHFNDEYRRPDSEYGRGLYLGFYVQPAGESFLWKIDLWGWDDSAFAEHQASHRVLASALAGADRDLILRIKHAVFDRSEYRRTVTSMDIYEFVIQRAGRDVADFDAFLARRHETSSH